MKLMKILPFAQFLLQTALEPGDIAIDGTCGNGHDTAFLANIVGKTGHVYGFDIQKEAIVNTTEKLREEDLLQQCTLIQTGHEHVKAYVSEQQYGQIKAAIFNLGYLPGGDKSIVTAAESTIAAIEQLLEIMAPKGVIVLVIYHGHIGGAIERDAVLDYATSLPQDKAHVLQYGFINQVNQPPFIVAIEKIK